MSGIKNIGTVFELSRVTFGLARLRVGFLFKFCNCYIFNFGGWPYFLSETRKAFSLNAIVDVPSRNVRKAI